MRLYTIYAHSRYPRSASLTISQTGKWARKRFSVGKDVLYIACYHDISLCIVIGPDILHVVSYGVDIDAVAGWLGSYGGEDSTSDISRGMQFASLYSETESDKYELLGLWAGSIGTQRLLKLFEKYNIKASWFIPGHSLETFPEECAMVRDAGHEIGLHGYSHENPVDMTLEQQRDVLDKTWKMLTEFCGQPPRGSVAPWWETSEEGTELMLSYGIEYDHSMSHHDCQMYWLRTGDTWTKIDYSKKAEEWMKPLVKGKETGLVEIPGSW